MSGRWLKLILRLVLGVNIYLVVAGGGSGWSGVVIGRGRLSVVRMFAAFSRRVGVVVFSALLVAV